MNMHTPADDSDGKSSSEVSSTPCPLTSLTGFKRDQLFVIQRLADQNPHGLVIKTELDRHYDERITQGRLYQNLGELVEEGYVEKHPLDGRTNAYRLSTHAARRLLDQYKWEQQCLQQETE